MTCLELRAVRKYYGPLQVLAGIELDVPAGSRTAIIGPSGSGKTTLLRLIAGFEAPDTGRLTLDGLLLADDASCIPAHQRSIGFVPQDGALFPHLTVADNVGFGLPRSTPGRDERIAELMDMVALDVAMLKRRPHEISGGQQQRVALARALAQRPRLMLLDEPFSALDTGLRASTRKAVARLLGDAGITTILVTHDQAEALSFADQVAVMRAGQLVQAGGPAELYLRPRDADIASFLGEAIVLPAQVKDGWADCALGRLAIDNDQRQGVADIMLRPEQLSVVAVAADVAQQGADATACYGTITDTDFGGSICVLSVRLLPGNGAQALAPHGMAARLEEAGPLLVRSPALQVPPVGATVRVSVTGRAHVFGSATR